MNIFKDGENISMPDSVRSGVEFKLTQFDIFLFIFCCGLSKSKIKKSLYENCVSQFEFYLNPHYYFRVCALNEMQLSQQMGSGRLYSAKISSDFENYQIDRADVENADAQNKSEIKPDFTFDYHK